MVKRTPEVLAVQSWRLPTIAERKQHVSGLGTGKKKSRRARGNILAVRSSIAPVDMYCYLRTRFGQPNGIQSLLLHRKGTSDNYIHWDYLLMAATEYVYILGLTKEFHIIISHSLAGNQWLQLIKAIKEDFGRIGREKSAFLKTLQKWVIFPNKYVRIAHACAELHASISEELTRPPFKMSSFKSRRGADLQFKVLGRIGERANRIHNKCLQLSLLTPVLAEAFINMLILILCKPEIRANKRQFDAWIRQNVDVKVFDLSYKCDGFTRPVEQGAPGFTAFKRIMDKRNNAIHGNVNPEEEAIEVVYFEDFIPIFKEPGDAVVDFLDSTEKQYRPAEVIDDYVQVHSFFEELLACIDSKLVQSVRAILEDAYPGYDVNRKITGVLLPEAVTTGYLPGLIYDDELVPSS